DRGNQADVDVTTVKQLRALRRQIVAKRKSRRPVEAVHEWAGVEVAHRAQTDGRHWGMRSNRPFLSIGSRLAARMFRRISSSGAPRGPALRSSSADTPSTSSAPTVSATWASFGPYSAQST